MVEIGLHVCSSGMERPEDSSVGSSGFAFQHLGGIHSGCALSGVLWLLFKVVYNFRHLDVNHDAILIMGVITNVAVIISALSAFPWVRNTHHKYVPPALMCARPDQYGQPVCSSASIE
jgi:hypothetical protein